MSVADNYRNLNDTDFEAALRLRDQMVKVKQLDARGGSLAKLEKVIQFELSEIQELKRKIPEELHKFLDYNINNIHKAIQKEREQLDKDRAL
jgi:hypothetical protein